MGVDREKVIKGLESCLNNDCHMDKCPYCEFVGNEYVCLENFLMRDALELLKEQEAVKPKKVKGYNPPMYTLYEFECKECKSPMMNKQPYCMGCGREVEWDE